MNKNQKIQTAIANKLQMEFFYEGHKRTVDAHHLGMLGNELQIHAYQISDGSSSGEPIGWKNFKVADIKLLRILSTKFIPETSYNAANSHYTKILKQVTA